MTTTQLLERAYRSIPPTHLNGPAIRSEPGLVVRANDDTSARGRFEDRLSIV